MIPDIEIRHSAWALIKCYGADAAALRAAIRAKQLLTEGDVEGASTWMRIIGAIGQLLSEVPAEEEKRH